MSEKLRECPFCGGEPILIEQGHVASDATRKSTFRVQCLKCGIMTMEYPASDTVIEIWNHRAGHIVEPENRPLTLDELRQMDWKPVYIVEWPDWGHWELSTDATDYLKDRDPDFYGMKYDDPCGWLGLHMLGWLAYRTKPEADYAN